MNDGALLEVRGLNAYYGRAHVLQGLDFTVGDHPVSIIGRNGMGKTTMCHVIMGIPPGVGRGSIRFGGLELCGKPSYKIARAGLAPRLVEELVQTINRLAEGGVRVLLVEQNLGVATAVADRHMMMVAGRIAAQLTSEQLNSDTELQRRYLGVEPLAE